LGVNAIPTTFFIDRNGILRAISVSELREDFVNQLLAEQAKTQAVADAGAPTDATPAVAAPAAVQTDAPTVKPPAPIQDSEPQHLLRLAKLHIANHQPDLAMEKLHQIIDNYPSDPAAATAKDLLAQISGQ
jgi:TolA-binding protein